MSPKEGSIPSSIKRNHARTRIQEAPDTYDQWWVHFPIGKIGRPCRYTFLTCSGATEPRMR